MTRAAPRDFAPVLRRLGDTAGALRRDWPLALTCLLLFAVPWENALTLSGVGTVGRLLAIVAIVGGLVAALARGHVARPPAALVLMALYLLYVTASYFVRLDPTSSFVAALSSLQLAAVAWLLWDVVRTREALRWALGALVAGAWVNVGSSVGSFVLAQPTRFAERYSSANLDPNELGLILALMLPAAWWLAGEVRAGLLRAALIAYLPLALFALMISGSRGGLVAYGCGLLYVLYDVVRGRRLPAALRLGVLGALGGSALLVAVLAPAAFARLGTLGGELADGNLNDRTAIWAASWSLAGESPLWGLGVGRFAPDLLPYYGQSIVAHNTLITVAVESGLVGLALFVLYLVALGLRVWRLPAGLRPMWLATLLCLVVGTSTLTWNGRKLTWILPALALCSAALSAPATRRKGGPA